MNDVSESEGSGTRIRAWQLVSGLLAVALAAGSGPVAAQADVIAGRVLNASTMAPLSGAQITVQGMQVGTVTDAAGRFRLEGVAGPSVVLEVQMLGYRATSQTVRAGDADLRIMLTESAVELNEIVVTGTAGGTQKRALGNTVASVRASDVQDVLPAADVTRLINGRAPGVQVAPGTGMVGSGPRIRIRGSSTLSLSDQPLIYVDGIRVDNDVSAGPTNQGYGSGSISRLGDFDPDEIESIEIIKGPAAATLYGTEASNGVIQIITKKGQTDMPAQWELTVRQGANWFHDPENRVPLNWGLDANGELIGVNLVQHEADRGTPVFRTGHIQEYGVSVRGGSNRVRYYLSGKYDRAEGIDINNEVWSYNVRSNLGFTPSDSWDLNASIGYVKSDIGLANDIGSGTLFNLMFSTNVDTAGARRGFRSAPPEVFRQRSLANQLLDRFTGSIQVQHKPADWLTHRLTVGLDRTNEYNSTLSPFLDPAAAAFFSRSAALGSKQTDNVEVDYNTVDYTATARWNATPSLVATTSVGGQYYRRQTLTLGATGLEFTGPGLSTVSGTARNFGREDLIENVTVGTFLQEEIGWRDRLFVTGAVRVDNNSAFGSDFDFVTYPKVSASWVVNEESFWNVPLVNTMRLRAAFGKSGQQPETFAALRTFKSVTVNDGEGGVTPEFVGNASLEPERGQEFETGFEAGLFDDRVGIDFTYYAQNTKDAILLRPLAPSGGFPGAQFVNIGEIQNRGFEVQLRANVIQRDAVAWEVGFNFSKNDNKVIDVSGAASGVAENGAHYVRMGSNLDTPGIHLRHQEGLPAGSWFGRRVVSAQLDANGQAFDVMCDGGVVSTSPLPCDEAPEVFLGRSDPNVEGSFTTSITLFRGLTLTGLLDFKQGVHHGENDTLVKCVFFFSCLENYRPQDGDPVFVAQIQSADLHTIAVSDASFVKVRDVSLSYLIPQRLVGALGATAARLTVSARNLKTWTDWTSIDPETYFLSHQFDKWSQTFTPHPMSFVVTANLIY